MKTSIVRGVYTDWTAPFFKGFRNQGALDHLNRDDYKNMILLLSVLKWKQFNGPAILYADNAGFEYYNSLGILDTWDEVNTEVIENIDTDKFSPSIFWAFAKLLTTKIESRSSVQIDTDLIYWSDITNRIEQSEILVLHPEPLSKNGFRDLYTVRPITKLGYEFKKEWNWSTNVVNTALLYIKSQPFVDYWFSEVEKFAAYNNEVNSEDMSRRMIFVEQQLLALCMNEWGIQPSFIIEDIDDCSDNKEVTHIWAYKMAMDNDSNLKLDFTKKIARRIVEEFPSYGTLDWMQRYLTQE